MNPIFSIIIPCRNNASSLKDTIQTILNNDYYSYEIIICDNNSVDNTGQIVSDFKNKKIKYFNSESDLSMSENWERGLDYINGDYLFYLGGDDGLVKDCFKKAIYIFNKYSCEILSWEKPNFQWPSAIYKPNAIKLNKKDFLIKMNPKKNLLNVLRGNLSYGYLPSIYNSFVKSSFVRELKKNNNIFFKGIHPDIYSSLILSTMATNQIYYLNGLSINGASEQSNGLNNCQGDNLDHSINFFQSSIHSKMSNSFPSITGLPSSYVLDSLSVFTENYPSYLKFLNSTKYINNIINELVRIRPGQIRKVVCQEFFDKYNLKENQKKISNSISESKKFISKKLSEKIININAESYEINLNQVKDLNIIDAQDIIYRTQRNNENELILIGKLRWKIKKLFLRIIHIIETKI